MNPKRIPEEKTFSTPAATPVAAEAANTIPPTVVPVNAVLFLLLLVVMVFD